MSDDDKRAEALRRFKASRLSAAMTSAREQQTKDDCEDCTSEDTPTTAASPFDVAVHGIAAPLGEPTGDGRQIDQGALRWDLDLEGVPIIWDRDEGDHTGRVVGRLDHISDDGPALSVVGRLFASEDAQSAADVARLVELIGENAVGWSLSLDDEEMEIEFVESPVEETRDGKTIIRVSRADELMRITSARVRHLAIVDTPAFPAARPVLGPPPALAAAAAVHTYPSEHFAHWESRDPVPLQVTPDGRVWGHAAGDGCFRDGSSTCRKYTADPDPKLRNFHTGSVTLSTGEVIRAGALTCASLHADTRLDLSGQRRHHEDTSTVWAKVIAWHDNRGRLCVSGSVVPGLDEKTVGQVAGMPVSVELWPVQGSSGLALVGMHTVVSPAWPVAAAVQ